MFSAKLANAKEVLNKFGVADLSDIEPLKSEYSANVKTIATLNTQIGELHRQQSYLLKLQEVYQEVRNGTYIDKVKISNKEQKL